MNPHAHIRSHSTVGLAQPAGFGSAEHCSAKPCLHPPKGAVASFGAALQEAA